MDLTRTFRRSVVVSLLALVVGAPSAFAWTETLSAPVTRGGRVVGQASATFVTANTGWAIANAKVTGFTAPSANAVWRTRTSLRSSCADPKTDPDAPDGETGPNAVAVTFSSPWYRTRIRTTKGNLLTNDVVKECPKGQGPAGSVVVTLTVQNAAGTATVGRAQLFAAG